MTIDKIDKNDIIVKIMDRNFHVKCPADKVADLHKAAKYFDEKIAEMRSNDKLISLDNLITIAALNITNEFLIQKRQNVTQIENMNQQINYLREQIAKALEIHNSEQK
jgi:cell division protein ZapA